MVKYQEQIRGKVYKQRSVNFILNDVNIIDSFSCFIIGHL